MFQNSANTIWIPGVCVCVGGATADIAKVKRILKSNSIKWGNN